MKKLLINLFIILLTTAPLVKAQNSAINKDDFNKTFKQISDSLPKGWSAKTDTAYPNEIILQSQVIELEPDITSNDPPELKGQCEIFIMVLPRVSPDSINIIRKRNKELGAALPPQNSKDNLKTWYDQNAVTLKQLDAEPTHYDNNFSYRIKCRRLPKDATDKANYNKVMSYLNKMFLKYKE
jgi:hypothetical protein